MTFKKFVDNIEKIYADQGDKPESERLRYGQTIMNVLWDIWPEKYDEIKDSDFNCFYTNRNVAIVLDKLEKEWR